MSGALFKTDHEEMMPINATTPHLRDLVASTLDYESRDCGSNPDGGDFFTITKLAASE